MFSGGQGTSNIVVFGLGAALVVFLAGATAAVAAGQTPPTAMWAAGAAISGALIGMLVPSPGAKTGHERAAEAFRAAAQAASAEAGDHAGSPRGEAARAAAEEATKEATAHVAAAATATETTGAATLLLLLFFGLLGLAVALASGAVEPANGFLESLKAMTTAVMALASAAGTALIGLLAPTPGKSG